MIHTPNAPVITRKTNTAQNENRFAAMGVKNVIMPLRPNEYPKTTRPPYHSDKTPLGNCVII